MLPGKFEAINNCDDVYDMLHMLSLLNFDIHFLFAVGIVDQTKFFSIIKQSWSCIYSPGFVPIIYLVYFYNSFVVGRIKLQL